MWYSQRDLTTSRLDRVAMRRRELFSIEKRKRFAKQHLEESQTWAGYEKVKQLFEAAENNDYDNFEYMSARDFYEKHLDYRDKKITTPNKIGYLLNVWAELYDLDVIEVKDFWPGGCRGWIRLYPVPRG